jgi:hypothetical protein
MRYLVIALAISASTTVDAQIAHRPAPVPVPRQQPASGPPPLTGPRMAPPSVAPPIVLPFPPLMTPPAGGLTNGFPFVPPDQLRSRPDLFRARRSKQFVSPLFVPFVSGYGIATEPAPPPSPPPAATTGTLRLSVTPTSAQVFVDSFYAGTVEEIEAQRGSTLPTGPHRIEIRAPDYEPLAINVQIRAFETTTYRGALELKRPAVPVRPASTAPMYLIPNCYLGNVPPRPARLPSGCDITRVQVLAGQ